MGTMANTTVVSQTSILRMVVAPISKLTETWSPKVVIHDIPWQIETCKSEEGNSLAVYLNCVKKDDSSNWSVPACATIKLVPIAKNESAHVRHFAPFVFQPSELSLGCVSFIQWNELMKDQNKYVQNDTIRLEIEITAEDPNYVGRSALKFKPIDKSCDCGSLARFRLTVTNIDNLLAVCSSPFIVRGLPWNLTIYKNQSSKLGVMLDLIDPTEEASCKMKMSVKLMSSKDGVDPIKKIAEKQVEKVGILEIRDIISWEDLHKSENGFVKENSITLEVKLKAEKPECDVPDVDPNNAVAAKRNRLECSICLEDIDGQDTSSTTPCGHIFCTACIKKAIKSRKICPMCKKVVKTLQRVYLPVSN